MDKRIIKTKRDIRNAYLELRNQYSVEKIKVSELCELAIINKSTFYKYYEDIFSLADEVEDDTLNVILRDFSDIDCLFTDPMAFIEGIEVATNLHAEEIRIIYKNRMSELVSQLETRIKGHYKDSCSNSEQQVLISFLIGGATHAILDLDDEKEKIKGTLNRYISELIQLENRAK